MDFFDSVFFLKSFFNIYSFYRNLSKFIEITDFLFFFILVFYYIFQFELDLNKKRDFEENLKENKKSREIFRFREQNLILNERSKGLCLLYFYFYLYLDLSLGGPGERESWKYRKDLSFYYSKFFFTFHLFF